MTDLIVKMQQRILEMSDILQMIEEAKRRKDFDVEIRRVLELQAIRLGVPLDDRGALQMIRLRVNRDIVLPGLDDD